MATVPNGIFDEFESDIETGNYYGQLYGRLIKMSIIAIREAIKGISPKGPIPLVLALPQSRDKAIPQPAELILHNIKIQPDLAQVDIKQAQLIHTGRAGGIQTLEIAQRFLYGLNHEYVLIGGVDSYCEYPILMALDEDKRLMATGRMDSFVPGEGAAFLLVTRNPAVALQVQGQCISLGNPGIAQEPGYMESEEPYLGEGLDQAFKKALLNTREPVTTLYSSMNGENFWAKEYGVALMRNQQHFVEELNVEHPADCFGDLGAATGTTLLILSAARLLSREKESSHLVYASSDNQWRAVVGLNKVPQLR